MGAVAFRRRYTSPVLVVTGRVTRAQPVRTGDITPSTASKTPRRAAALALLHRVFPLVKADDAGPGAVSLGRTVENDVAIPEHSISKRHCTFEVGRGSIAIRDCGSTNGTLLNGARLPADEPVALCGGEAIVVGRFTFVFETPSGFLELVSGLAR